MFNCIFDELFDAQAIILRHIKIMNIFAFNFGSLVCDQITEMPNSDCIKWWQVKPKLVSAEMIGLRFILEL